MCLFCLGVRSETRHAAHRGKVLVLLAWDVDGILVKVLAAAMVSFMVGHMAPYMTPKRPPLSRGLLSGGW